MRFSCLGILGALLLSSASLHAEDIHWKKLDDAMSESARSHKPVFLMIHAKWCGYCRKMESITFRDPEVSRLLATKFTDSKLDGEGSAQLRWPPKKAISEAEIAYSLGVRGYPTLIFFRHDRKELARISSYLNPVQMKALLNAVLSYDASGALDKGVDFEHWYAVHQR